MGWKAVIRSSLEASHIMRDTPSQDSGGYICFEDIFIGAVSDGAENVQFSKLGSKIAVTVALKVLKYQMQSKLCINSQEEAIRIFSFTLEKTLQELHEQAYKNNCHFNDFACTLLLLIASPNWMAAMQIGNGFIATKSHDKKHELLFKSERWEFDSKTTFITSIDIYKKIQIIYKHNYNVKFFCISTYKIEKLVNHFSDQTLSTFFYILENYLNQIFFIKKERKLIQNFPNSSELNVKTDNNKTLLLCLHNKIFLDRNDEHVPTIDFNLEISSLLIESKPLEHTTLAIISRDEDKSQDTSLSHREVSLYKYMTFLGILFLIAIVTILLILEKHTKPKPTQEVFFEKTNYQFIELKETTNLVTDAEDTDS